ncbi:MAG: helix-turn-helix transcriptional regulator [Microbacterium arborescens]
MSQSLNLDVIQARAKKLAAEDRAMRRALVALRREAGLTQQDVADFMGCTQQAVQKLERYDADPQLSTLRRYANAVGALVAHEVRRDDTTAGLNTYGGATVSSPAATSTAILPIDVFVSHKSASYQAAAESKRTDFALGA